MLSFFQKHSLSPEDTIIIACSGGADSMFLLVETLKIHPKKGVIVAHFNHQLRGEESIRDEEFVRDFCIRNNLIIEVGTADIQSISKAKKLGMEEAARNERYSFLHQIRDHYRAKYILTAHHLDDSIETFFFNLLRGTKLTGLSGISEKNNYVLRPLLHLQKNDILIHCATENIPYIIDSTNIEETIQRNYIRQSIVPLFSKINPSYPRAIDNLMQYFSEIQKHLNNEVLGILEGSAFPVKKYEELPMFLKKELLRHLFSITNNGTIGLTESNLTELDRYIRTAKGSTVKSIKGLKLSKKLGRISFDKID